MKRYLRDQLLPAPAAALRTGAAEPMDLEAAGRADVRRCLRPKSIGRTLSYYREIDEYLATDRWRECLAARKSLQLDSLQQKEPK